MDFHNASPNLGTAKTQPDFLNMTNLRYKIAKQNDKAEKGGEEICNAVVEDKMSTSQYFQNLEYPGHKNKTSLQKNSAKNSSMNSAQE